jgi:hypothetical protein
MSGIVHLLEMNGDVELIAPDEVSCCLYIAPNPCSTASVDIGRMTHIIAFRKTRKKSLT